jgi:purine-binding chemotaxis protein CheW
VNQTWKEYGISLLKKMREIIRIMPITPMPRTSGFMKDVINFRGMMIPVVDLRLKSGMEEVAYTARTWIIVIEITDQTGCSLMGPW